VECKNDTINNKGMWNHLKSFRKFLSNIPGKHEIKGLGKTAILGTAHMFWKVLIEEYKTFDI
jgi:hypothetical protein